MKIIICSLLLLFTNCQTKNKSENKILNNSVSSSEVSMTSTIIIKINKPTKNVPLILYEPINNASNFAYYQKNNEINITKDTTISFTKNCNQPNSYVVRYGMARAILYVFPSDTVVVAFEGKPNGYSMRFAGDDSLFHKRYNEDAYKIFMDKGFDTIIPKKPETPSKMISKLESYINNKTKFLDSIYTSGINTEKNTFFKKMYQYSIAAISTNPISIYYPESGSADLGWFNELYKLYPPFDSIALKCFYGNSYIDKYLYDIDKKRTSVYTGKYDTTWKSFLSYSNIGYAPNNIQETALGNMLILLSKNNSGEINVPQAFQKYVSKFPQSQYNPIIKKLQNKDLGIFSGVFIKSQSSSISELWNSNFKNTPVFIDLWATWCIPCIAEFEFKDELQNFLKSKGIKMLYLSMDDAKDSKKWNTLVKSLKLNAFNHLANEALKKDILKSIYNDEEWSIPRYILIDKVGNIVLKDALLPSNKAELYAQIENSLK